MAKKTTSGSTDKVMNAILHTSLESEKNTATRSL